MQIETIMRYHCIPLKMAEITPNASEVVEKLGHSCIGGTATLETSLALSFQAKNGLAI